MVGRSISFVFRLDDSDWKTRIRRVQGDIGKTKLLAKDLGVEFQRATGLLKTLGLVGVGAAASVSAVFTGVLSQSPQFKEFWGRMKKPFFDLSNFLGQIFKPAMDSVRVKFQEFVDVLRNSESARRFFKSVNDGISDFVDSISGEDMKGFIDFFSDLGDRSVKITVDIVRTIKDVVEDVKDAAGVEGVEEIMRGEIKGSGKYSKQYFKNLRETSVGVTKKLYDWTGNSELAGLGGATYYWSGVGTGAEIVIGEKIGQAVKDYLYTSNGGLDTS